MSDIILATKDVNSAGPLDAREAGIETVFPKLALAGDLNPVSYGTDAMAGAEFKGAE